MAVNKGTILTVDDNRDILDVLRLTLESEGYEVKEALNGKEAIAQVKQGPPDLIVLDYMMPEMNGHEVARLLKSDILYRHIPIIMLTAKGDVQDKVKGIEAGVDDYVVKPFEPIELLARVKMILRRTMTSLDANPLTKLPGNVSIKQEMQKRLDNHERMAVCHLDLRQFKAFNDKYGFEHGDKVIKFTGELIAGTVKEIGKDTDFAGHIGGDDFIIICGPDIVDMICQEVIKRFDQGIPKFYSEEDRARSYIISHDRKGNINKFPIMTIYIAVVTNERISLECPEEISEIGADLGAYAKTFSKSIYIKDRRAEPGK
ncbi:MAG: response regulator [bacterium]|nr:response regulator [bacterium]